MAPPSFNSYSNPPDNHLECLKINSGDFSVDDAVWRCLRESLGVYGGILGFFCILDFPWSEGVKAAWESFGGYLRVGTMQD